ncbi:MAG: hypothetical protein QF733_05950 [Phycisphaerales bacterium]|jgi:hypothetical protein|nr:hypothetical protein [Phycisphaerales bacterium]
MPTVHALIRRLCTITAAAALMTWCPGCLPPSAPLHARLEVRDAATGRPVPDATVRWTGGNLFIPPREVLGPPISPAATPAGGRAVTDEDGVATLTLAGNRPNDLTVQADGYQPVHVVLKASASTVGGAVIWTEGIAAPSSPARPAAPTLQVRVRPAQ